MSPFLIKKCKIKLLGGVFIAHLSFFDEFGKNSFNKQTHTLLAFLIIMTNFISESPLPRYSNQNLSHPFNATHYPCRRPVIYYSL